MKDNNFKLMESAPIPQAILKLAIPTVLSTIVSLIYNLTDTYFIGLLDDPVQLGAISLAFPVFIVIQAVGNIFGNGAPSYISRCLGGKKFDEVRKSSSVSVYSSVIATLVISACVLLFMDPVLGLLGTSENTFAPTKQYLTIIVGLGFVLTLQITLPALLRAEGKIKEAVIGMIIGTGLNIVLDPVFILGFHQGVAGAAWATILGNVFAVAYYLFVLIKGDTTLSVSIRDFKPSARILREILKIGLPASISQIIMSFATILLNNMASAYGDNVISAYGVAGKLITIVIMIVMGYVSGYMPFAGYNFGANKIKRMLSSLKFTMVTSTVICLFLLIPFLGLAPAFMRAFTSNEEIIRVGIEFLKAQAWCVPFMGIQVTMMATFQSTGEAIRAMVVSLGRQCIFYIPLLYLFNFLWKLTGLMYAQMAADLLTTLVAVLIGIPLLRKLSAQNKKALSGEEEETEAKKA